jgi:RNA polymerase sigma factor (sigma-70 family)
MITSHISARRTSPAAITRRRQPRGSGERLSSCDLTRLVGAAAAGDVHGLDRLVREFEAMVRAVARAHRLCEADTADVAQATWLKLLEHVDRIHDPACVGPWLATTARRECLKVLRDSRRQIPSPDVEPEREESPPSDELLVTERNEALWRGFARLRTSDQRLLKLLMADPPPDYAKISGELNMPVGSIGPTRARALERLRAQLDNAQELSLLVG